MPICNSLILMPPILVLPDGIQRVLDRIYHVSEPIVFSSVV
jgi:hypothetical protein